MHLMLNKGASNGDSLISMGLGRLVCVLLVLIGFVAIAVFCI